MHVAAIEKLAKDKGWDDFTVAEDIIEYGENTTPYLLFGFCSQRKKVVSVCTLVTPVMGLLVALSVVACA